MVTDDDNQSLVENEPTANSPFDHIVDDTEERAEAREWIHRGFTEGRDPDEMLRELTDNGWSADDAEAMVEEGRRATRRLRGGFTRDDVIRVADERYRSSFSNIGARFGMGGLLLVVVHFLLSLASFCRIPWPQARAIERPKDEPLN